MWYKQLYLPMHELVKLTIFSLIFCVTIVDIEHLCHHSGIGIIEPLVIHLMVVN